MNRRDFMKFFGVTAATAASATALANIPEAEPKIQLLEPRKPVSWKDPIFRIENISELRIHEDGNYHGILPGQRIKTVQAQFCANSVSKARWVAGREIDQAALPILDGLVTFDIRQLQGETFIVTELEIEAAVDSVLLARVTAVKVV